MRNLLIIGVLAMTPAMAQTTKSDKPPPTGDSDPVCYPIGQTAKHELVYSMFCKNLPGDKPSSTTQTSTVPAAPPHAPIAK